MARKKPTRARPLWTCPACGHRFVTANMWHSCGTVDLDEHFRGKDPKLRTLFDAWLALVQRFGPVTVIPQKSRITFQIRVRFAGAVVYKTYLRCSFWLKHRVDHPMFAKVDKYGDHDYVYHLKVTDLKQLKNPDLLSFLRQAHKVGRQEV